MTKIINKFKDKISQYRVLFFSVLLIISGIFVWRNTLNNQFLYDDDALIVLNGYVRTLTPITKYFSAETSTYDQRINTSEWRPLTKFVFALNYHFWGLNPKPYHLLVALIHIFNALLVFWLVFLILNLGRRRDCRESMSVGSRNDNSLIAAFITALVFLVHPAQVETVAWVTQTGNVLFLFFYLLSLIFIVKSGERRAESGISVGRRLPLIVLSLLCFIFSLLSKEMSISLPLVIFGYYYILKKQKIIDCLINTLPYLVILFFFILIRSTIIGQTAQNGYWAGGFIPQMLTMVKGFAYYVKLMFVPYPLNVEYLFPIKHTLDFEVIVYGVLLISIIYTGWRLRKTQPIISFGIFLFFLALSPASNIIPINTIINERYLYPAVIGFGLILGQGLVAGKKLFIRYLLSAVLLILFSFITINRIGDWKDHWAFVTANLKTCPQSAMLHYGMGRAYASKGMFEEASKEFELCLKIDPQYEEATNDLGRLAAKTGVIANSISDETISKYRQTVQKRVDFFDGLFGLGIAYFNKGDYKKAVEVLEKACTLNPDLKTGHGQESASNLAVAYAYSGKLDKAIKLCKEILEKDQKMTKTRYNLGMFYGTAGMTEEAKKQYKIVLAENPDHQLAKSGLKEVEVIIARNTKIVAANVNSQKTVDLHQPLQENQNEVTKFIQEKFPDPVVQESIMMSGGVEFENTKDGITLKKGYLGSSQPVDKLKPAEIQALEAMKKRDSSASPQNDNTGPEYVFAENIKDGYTVRYQGKTIKVKHVAADVNPQNVAAGLLSRDLSHSNATATIEPGAIIYKNAYKDSDVLYVFNQSNCQEMILLRNENSPKKFEYEVKAVSEDEVKINENGELSVGGMALSKPVVFDADGKKVVGKWELGNVILNEAKKSGVTLSETKGLGVEGRDSSPLAQNDSTIVKLSFNSDGLKYPVLIDPTWRAAVSMSTARDEHTATLLPNGKVLIAGGSSDGGTTGLSTAELYDPATGSFSATGDMLTTRFRHTATLLPNGKVLIAGGSDGGNSASDYLGSAELYNPDEGTFSATDSMSVRGYHTATLLPNGKVLITGGYNGSGSTDTAHLYNPTDGTFSATGTMTTSRNSHTATLLPNGNVLIAGGPVDSTAEVYNPTAGTFFATGSMLNNRWNQTATLLPTGKVLITGGWNGSGILATAELYNSTAGTFSTTDAMSAARYKHSATLLPNGTVLITGGSNVIVGNNDTSASLATAQLYNPTGGTFFNTGSMGTTRRYHTTTLLPNGKVLITGGWNGSASLSTAQLYDPAAGTFSATGTMSTIRERHTATLLPNGKVLIAGGTSDAGTTGLATAELYDPATGSFSATTGTMSTGRYGHTATLLPNGKVLIAGGSGLSTAELYNAGTFAAAGGTMSNVRYLHTATLLPNGNVLITGGYAGAATAFSTAELYNPTAETFSATTGTMTNTRREHTATLLPNGKVLITGGSAPAISTAELYNPADGTFSATTGVMSNIRYRHTATLLTTGKVLIAGGSSGAALSTAELYNPSAGTFSTTSPMLVIRYSHPATLLPNGKVLITGGSTGSGTHNTAELYDPATGSFSATTGTMSFYRYYHTATLLPNGKVLVAGGPSIFPAYAELVLYTEYDYSVVASTMQPSITAVDGSGSFPVKIKKDTEYIITGVRFKGYSQGSGGGYCQIDSPTNYPRVYLQKMDTGNFGTMSEGGWQIDVTTSVYLITDWWPTADTSISFKTPNDLSSGYWLLYVMSNAIPSNGVVINCVWPSTYKTMVGNAATWQWDNAQLGDAVPSGTADDWQWQSWTPWSGRKVPQGTADNWSWGNE